MASSALLVQSSGAVALSRSSFLSGTRLRSAPAPSLAAPRGLGLSVGPVRAQFRDSDKVTDKIPGEAKNAAKSLERALQDQKKEGLGTSGTLGFTKRNELFVGRMAMIGIAAALIGESLTGKGPLAQAALETGIPLTQAPPLLLAFIGFTFFGAFTGGKGSQGYQEADPFQPAKAGNLRGLFGLAERGPLFGFTRPNEVFNGRLAQLGFASALVGELITGRGILGQLNLETGAPIPVLQALLLFGIPLIMVASVNLEEQRFVNDDDVA